MRSLLNDDINPLLGAGLLTIAGGALLLIQAHRRVEQTLAPLRPASDR